MPDISTEQIKIFLSLFRGREDVFAVRWEKEGKSGYMPAYDFNWDAFAKHTAKGGTLKDFPDKRFSKLTEQRVINHFTGKEVLGIYPLLQDNSSWFIVADFDENLSGKKSWMEECKAFVNACKQLSIPVYPERSRSGNGGHVWIFFDTNYPAYKSRKIVLHILESSGIISAFDKNTNYDRLFPNQDYHSGKGLGNLIALPLQKAALEKNNSCFINADTQTLYTDQWSFLQSMQRVPTAVLGKIFESITNATAESNLILPEKLHDKNAIRVILDKQVIISRNQLNANLVSFLRDNLNFVNSEYIIKKKLGKNTFGTETYFRMLEEKDGMVLLPKGFTGRLLRFCKEQNIVYELVDKRVKHTEINFSFKTSLYQYQQQAVDATKKKEMGIIAAPPGSGKTIMALAVVADKKQPALIIVHRKQLFDQWVERIQSFLGIAEPFIGKISGGNKKIGTHITVAMMQSIATIIPSDEIFNSFGTIIVDECHHIPAKTFRQGIKNFSSYYLYGLTATPVRKNNDEKLIFIHIGEIIHGVKLPAENKPGTQKLSVIIRETDLLVPFDYKTDKTETLYQVLIHDTARNRLIIDDIKTEVNAGKKVLVLTERKAHIDVLHQYLKNKYEIITISGEDSEAARKSKLQQIKEGHFHVLISTGQFLGEGADIDNLQCLISAYPFSFEGKLMQYIGRVQRGDIAPVIYDYRDIHIDYLEKQFRQRNRYYRKLMNAGELQKFDELTLIFDEDKVFVNNEDHVLPIACLDLSMEIEKFNEGVAWKVRVLKYDDENGILMTEILDYHAKPAANTGKQAALQLMVIDKISFRTIDTVKLLQAVVLKRLPFIPVVLPPLTVDEFDETEDESTDEIAEEPVEIPPLKPIERILKKTMKTPFAAIQFSNACVEFSLFIEELHKEIKFEIANADIRPEFEAIREYFGKILKKKLIDTELEVRYTDKQIISTAATSEDIDKINSSSIDSVRFEFVKKEILSAKRKFENAPALNTLDNLLAAEKNIAGKIFQSERELIDDILSIKNSKHYHQLKYLSAQHLSSVLKIRFVLNPFSFLFLIAGDKNYHIVWETLSSEEATYIWHFEKTMDALRKGLHEIETILNEIKATGKQDYLRKEHPHFSRVLHDYGDVQSGFVNWKGALESKIL